MPIPKQYQLFFPDQDAADRFLEFERLATMNGMSKQDYLNKMIATEIGTEGAKKLLAVKTATDRELVQAMAAEKIKGANRKTLHELRNSGEMDRPKSKPQLYFAAGNGPGQGSRVQYNLEECLKFFRDRQTNTEEKESQ